MKALKTFFVAIVGIAPTLANAAIIDLTTNTASYQVTYTNPSNSTVTFPDSTLTQVGSGATNSWYTDLTLLINSVSTTVRMTMTGWTVNPTSGNWTQAQLTPFGSGMGVCSTGESCSTDPQHRVDNNGNLEAVLFQFSNTAGTQSIQVDVNTVYLSAASAPNDDTDATYWARNITATNGPGVTLSGFTLASLQAAMPTGWGNGQNSDAAVGSRFAPILNNFSDTFLFAARVGQTDDFFKIRGIEVLAPNNSTTPGNESGIPEPSTYAMLGTGLLAVAYFRRKNP